MESNKKSNTALNMFHMINILISACLIILSILALSYIDKEITSYIKSIEQAVYDCKVLLITFVLPASVVLMIIGLFPSKKHSQNAEDADNNTEVVNGNWNWWLALIVFIIALTITYLLFTMSVRYRLSNYSLTELFKYSFSTSMFNRLAIMMLIGLFLLTFFSLIWKIILNHIRSGERYFGIHIERSTVEASLFLLGLMIGLIYYNLSDFKGRILSVLWIVFVNIFFFIFLPDEDVKNSVYQELSFEESDNTNQLRFFYDFGDANRMELYDYEQFNEGLKILKIAQEKKDLSKPQPVANAWIEDGNINGIMIISTKYNLHKSLFSKKVVDDDFDIRVCKDDENNVEHNYYLTVKDYEDVEKTFYEFIVNHRTPELDIFDCFD